MYHFKQQTTQTVTWNRYRTMATVSYYFYSLRLSMRPCIFHRLPTRELILFHSFVLYVLISYHPSVSYDDIASLIFFVYFSFVLLLLYSSGSSYSENVIMFSSAYRQLDPSPLHASVSYILFPDITLL